MIAGAQATAIKVLIIFCITILFVLTKHMRKQNFSEEEIALYQIGAATIAILSATFCFLSKAVIWISCFFPLNIAAKSLAKERSRFASPTSVTGYMEICNSYSELISKDSEIEIPVYP